MTPKYEKYVNLIRKEAWKRAQKHPGLKFDELVSQGNLAYWLAVKTWDPTRASFSTHLWWRIKDEMNADPIGLAQCEEEQVDDIDLHRAVAFKLALAKLSEEAQEVCSLIFNSSAELCDFTASSIRVVRINIKRYLSSMKWPWKKINQAMTEIKEMLKNLGKNPKGL